MGAASARELFLLTWLVLCAMTLETFIEGPCLGFLLFFEEVLLQVVTIKYLGLYQQTPVTLVLFWDVLLQVLAHLRYLSLY